MRLQTIFIVLTIFLLAACATPAPLATPIATVTPVPSTTLTFVLKLTSTPTLTPTLAPTFTPTPQPEPKVVKPKVVIVSIDGLRPDGLLQSNAPNIFALAKRGSYTWNAQTTFPPVTLPSHASMLSGYTPEGHGITWNDDLPDRGTIKTPTIFSIAHEAGLRTVMVVGKEKLKQLNAPGSVDSYVYATNGDPDVADQAIVEIQSGFDLIFVHLPNIDFFGHSTGWMSEMYLFEISNTDKAVGRILDSLPANTVVILSADHGGHGTIHGSNIPEDMTIPWIIAGPDVLADHLIASDVSTTDTAATAAYVLGLSLPPDAVGHPVYEAFGQAEPDLLHGVWRGGTAQGPARSEMPAAVLNGLIYVPGGFGGETKFQSYEPDTGVWADLAPLPEGRHHLMAAAARGKIFIFGGAPADSSEPTDSAYVYDPATDSWASVAAMPEPRLSGVAVTLTDKIYIVGGVGGAQTLLEYDPVNDNWRSRAALKQPREHLAAAVLDGFIYAIGGRWAGIGELISVEVYDPSRDEWRVGAPLRRPHSGFGAGVVRGQIMVAGGEIVLTGSETLTAMEVFDPKTDHWAFAPDMPIALHGLAVAAVADSLYVLGGSSRAGAIENLGRVLGYSP